MPLQSFYLQNQLVTGLYTAGGQWQLEDGTEYVGPYHQYINDRLTYTNSKYQKGVSKQLFPLVTDPNIKEYNKAANTSAKIWAHPKYHFPTVTAQHIQQSWIPRYFVQVRNNPQSTVIEINQDQFDNIGTTVNGLDDVRYNSINIRWRITGTPNDIINSNRQMLAIKNQSFPGIVNYLTDLTEFYQAIR
jgi:hypothetical protein